MSKGFKLILLVIFFVTLIPVGQLLLGVQEELKPLAQELSEISNGRLILGNARFGKVIGKNVLAQCNLLYKTITIDEVKFKKLSHKNKLIVLAHEYEHCHFNKRHVENWGSGFCPSSYMYPSNVGKWCSENYWNVYVKEMRGL